MCDQSVLYKCDWVLTRWSSRTLELSRDEPYVFGYKRAGNVVLNDVHNHVMKSVIFVKEEK